MYIYMFVYFYRKIMFLDLLFFFNVYVHMLFSLQHSRCLSKRKKASFFLQFFHCVLTKQLVLPH